MSDWTEDERSALLGFKAGTGKEAGTAIAGSTKAKCTQHKLSGQTIPDSVDYRTKDADGVTWSLPPKDQGTCGSCWTYGGKLFFFIYATHTSLT